LSSICNCKEFLFILQEIVFALNLFHHELGFQLFIYMLLGWVILTMWWNKTFISYVLVAWTSFYTHFTSTWSFSLKSHPIYSSMNWITQPIVRFQAHTFISPWYKFQPKRNVEMIVFSEVFLWWKFAILLYKKSPKEHGQGNIPFGKFPKKIITFQERKLWNSQDFCADF
jgi:hypothetical protein